MSKKFFKYSESLRFSMIAVIAQCFVACFRETSSQVQIFGGSSPEADIAASTLQIISSMADSRYGLCSGVLLRNGQYATAAHCDERVAHELRYGTNLTRQKSFCRSSELVKTVAGSVADVYISKYVCPSDTKALEGAVAVRVLDFKDLETGQDVWGAGFGGTLIKNEQGQSKFVGDPNKLFSLKGKYTETLGNFVYVEYGKGRDGSGLCSGDSGGPLYAKVNGELVVVAVASGVITKDAVRFGDAYCGYGAGYTALSPFVDPSMVVSAKATQTQPGVDKDEGVDGQKPVPPYAKPETPQENESSPSQNPPRVPPGVCGSSGPASGQQKLTIYCYMSKLEKCVLTYGGGSGCLALSRTQKECTAAPSAGRVGIEYQAACACMISKSSSQEKWRCVSEP